MGQLVRPVLNVIRRGMFLSVFAVLFLVSNIVLLLSDAVYDAAKLGLWRIASVAGDLDAPTTHRRNREAISNLRTDIDALEDDNQRASAELGRSQAKLKELDARNEALDRRVALLARERAELESRLRRAERELVNLGVENADLAADRMRFSQRVAELEDQLSETSALAGHSKAQAIAINERLARRTSRMISTNLSSMAVEAVPYLGAAAIVGVTFMEVNDACLTLADTRRMSLLLSGEPAEQVPACGYSPGEFWEIVRGGPDTTTCHDLSTELPPELRLDCTEILRPGEAEPQLPGEALEARDIRRPGE